MFSFHPKYFVYRELRRAPQKLSFCFKCPDTGTVRILGNILQCCILQFDQGLNRVSFSLQFNHQGYQTSKKVIFTVYLQNCRLLLTVKTFLGNLNLSISAPTIVIFTNWKNQFPEVLKSTQTLMSSINTEQELIISKTLVINSHLITAFNRQKL